MSRKKVLVTGAAGFVGSHLVDALLAAGNEVVGFDMAQPGETRNLELAKTNSRFTYVQGDIRDLGSLREAFTSDIEIVFHLASVVGISKYIADPFLLVDISVGGTRNVAALALEYGTHIVFSSTSEVYGRNPKIPWAEDDDRVLGSTTVDRWVYSTAKATCEHMLFGLHRMKGAPVTVVRYFNVYGPRQNPIFVISQSIHKVLNGEQPLVYDGGDQTRCFTYVEDAVRGTIMAASSEQGNGEIFNIGNSAEITVREAVELVIKYSGKDISWEPLDTKSHYGKTYEDIGRRVPNVQKAKNMLGWEILISHEAGIRRTVEWAKDNPWWLMRPSQA